MKRRRIYLSHLARYRPYLFWNELSTLAKEIVVVAAVEVTAFYESFRGLIDDVLERALGWVLVRVGKAGGGVGG